MITLLVMTDGRRDCITHTIPSALENLRGPISNKVIHDDSGDPEYATWLWDTFAPLGFVVHSTPGRSGFDGAMRSAWAWLREHDRNEWVFHLEDDFTFMEPIDLKAMAGVLDSLPYVVQMALERQPLTSGEQTHGIVKRPDRHYSDAGDIWREHREFFTTNPSLYRRSLIDREWPSGPRSEGMFSIALFTDPNVVSAYWGTGQLVEHIGYVRVGNGY